MAAKRGGTQVLPSDNSKNLVFRESQYASRNFNLDAGSLYGTNALVPKPKFLFFAKFGISKVGLTANLPDGKGNSSYANVKDGVIFQIKQIDKPKFNIQTETMNQYNKKRVVQTAIEYNPMTINFHDDIGDRVLKFWSDYFQYYYGDGGRNSTTDWKYDITTTEFFNGAKNGWGYRGNFNGISADQHFLEYIELYQFYGSDYTSMKFVNPIITIFDHDNNDYAEGREGTGIRISFDYEGVIYNLDNTSIFDSDVDFGFVNDYYDPVGSESKPANTNSRRRDINPTADLPQTILVKSIDRKKLDEILSPPPSNGASASGTVLASNTTFGSPHSNATSSLSNLTAASGSVPSADAIEKETGVKNAVNNYGVSSGKSVGSILANAATPRNVGIDSVKVDNAASILDTSEVSNEQVVALGQTKIAPSGTSSEFSRSMGTAAALAIREGYVDSVASYVNDITPDSSSSNTIVNKKADGSYQLTDRGSDVMNSMRSPNSALGVRKKTTPWTNPDSVNNNKRLLDAENGENNIV